jgi:hypothetical protein
VDNPRKLYRQRRRATQAKGLETLDSKSRRTIGIYKGITTSKSKGRSTLTATHGRTTTTGAQELCTPDIIDLPIINLTYELNSLSAISVKRRMEKMEIEKEAQHLKAAEARFTCKECEEYGHVQSKPRFNASSSIQDLVPLCTQLKDFMDEQAKMNEDAVTKFEAMEKVLENFDGKVTEVGNSLREVFVIMKMLETQMGQLVRQPMGNKGEFPPQGPGTVKATQTHSGEMEDHTKTTKITTEGPEFEMPSHYMKEVVASVRTKGQSQPVKTKNMTKPTNKPVPKMVRKWVPKIATPAKSVDP